ncbi:MAG TPA: SCO family protein [Thermoanaerobaculia bacterium]|jgi:protein SCO1/2
MSGRIALAAAVLFFLFAGEQRILAGRKLPDVAVVDHTGRALHFYSDLVRGRTVFVNAVYTDCEFTCPMLSKAFEKLQESLGDRLGRDVFLLSISRDPERDTPRKLAAWRTRYAAKPGWIVVTGKKKDIDELLRALTGDATGRGGHEMVTYAGHDRSGTWLRLYGAAEPKHYERVLAGFRAAE